ncbi:erythromycin esterase family protein [Tissierella carlieri]|uniref:erythromycin esterase family protein n=1 Tax=Tissierella carlieri TaxID=689904 RepID=UPI001C0FF533|nr:erythromycin esterase family protein [Tissierella carlieri]MBU5313770.1 erythromycin esterase family protein [Tissierella carlieri]
MNKKALIVLIVVIIIFTSFIEIKADAESELTTRLRENLIPLKTTEPRNGFEDLMPLKEILKDKKIIGMGEATHGTSEFFQMKHRMFKFLVEEMEYRVFGIEAEFGGAQIVNDYILSGKGSIQTCLDAMKFWTWNTQEVADMIEWMKEYNENKNNENKIRFYGFDMQSIDNSVNYVLDYLEKLGASNITQYRANLKDSSKVYYRPNKDSLKKFNLKIEKIHNDLIKNKDVYINNSSVEEYDLILQHMAAIDQWIDFVSNGSRFETRDYYMAENVKWILDYENKYYGNAKIMLWAHNGHIANSYFEIKNMGKNLKILYNEDYYSLGFDFYQGNFVAMPTTFYGTKVGSGLANFYISSSPIGSYGDEMNNTGIPTSFLDFKNAEKDKILLNFLSSKVHVNNIGATYFGKWHNVNPINKIVVRDTYDGMIFVKSTTEAKRAKPYISRVPDGKELLIQYYIFVAIIAIIVFVLLYTLYKKKKSTSNLTEKSSDKFYILDKYTEEKTDINIIEKLIIRINNYFNSISTFKYCVIVLFIMTILTITSIIMNSIDVFSRIYVDKGILAFLNLIFIILIGTGEIFLLYILPLNIIKALSKEKAIYLKHILIVSIIMALINSQHYFSSGILLYSFNILINIIYGLIYGYTYGLLYYKGKKPLITISIILVIYNILIMLGVVLISKI